MTFDEWWESDDAFKFNHMTERLIAAEAWLAARAHFQSVAYDAGVVAERGACIEDVRTVGGQFAVECEALIRKRSNA